MNFFERARDVFSLMPLVKQLVESIESAMPTSAGKDKFNAAWQMAQTVFGVAVELLPVVEKLAAAWVVILGMNKSGNVPPA